MRTTSMLLFLLLLAAVITGCTRKESTPQPETDIPLDDILSNIESAYGEDFGATMEIPPEVLEAEFGLTEDMYDEVLARMPMVSINNDRVVLVRAAEGMGEIVEETLQDARLRKIEDELQYPMNYAKTAATKVVHQGEYYGLLLLGEVDETLDPTSDDAKDYAEAQVQKAVNAFYHSFQTEQ